MARDYEDLHDVHELEDSELRELVHEQLDQHSGLDAGEISVRVKNGLVTLEGRVGTDEERRIADHILTDVLGIQEFTNDLLIDQTYRSEAPESADETDGEPFRERSLDETQVSLTDDSGVLADQPPEDPDGSSDIQEVMEDGVTWNPPDEPTAEGMHGSDAGPEEMGGRH